MDHKNVPNFLPKAVFIATQLNSTELNSGQRPVYDVINKKHDLEKTQVISLSKIALAVGYSTVCTILSYHISDVTQDVTEK